MENIKKETAVDWLYDNLNKCFDKFDNGEYGYTDFVNESKEVREQAKAMEKEQQIIEPKTSFISWVKNPNDEEDGLILIDEGVLIELPQKAKNDLIEYLKEFLKK